MWDHPASWPDNKLTAECTWRGLRVGGPGGQHRNKVETGVEILHTPTQLTGRATETRSQERNRAEALRRLRITLALRVRMDAEPETIKGLPRSTVWTKRSRGGRIVCAVTHHDLPNLLAEAFDVLHAMDWHQSEAAKVLGVSSSSLLKLFRSEHEALALLNAKRGEQGLRPLR